jgi:hypothetical protein
MCVQNNIAGEEVKKIMVRGNAGVWGNWYNRQDV